jgi:hypothetical protein
MEGYSQELALFERSIIDNGVQSIESIEFQPTAPLSESAAVEFNYSGASSDYIDLSKTRLKLKVKITLADGTTITPSNNVGLINLPLQSMFSQLDVYIQDKLVTSSTNSHYAYKSMFDVMFDSNCLDEKTALTSQLYYRDMSSNMNGSPIVIDDTRINAGLNMRYTYTCDGQTVDMEGPLYFDMAQQSKLLLNGVALHFKLWPNRSEFKLMAFDDEKYKIEIVEAKLNISMVKVAPTLLLAHASTLNNHVAIYDYTKSHLISYQIPANTYQFMQDDIFQSNIPLSLCIGIVSSEAFAGDYSKNPFNFEHSDVKSVGLFIDGKCQPSSRPINVDYGNKMYMEGYNSILQPNGKGLRIDRGEYMEGYTFYNFNIDPRYNNDMSPPIKKGLTRIEIYFASPTPQALTIILYAKSPSQLKIDGVRNVII